MSMAIIDTEGGGGDTATTVVRPPDFVYPNKYKNVGAYTREEIRNGRRILLTFNNDDEVILETDIGAAGGTGGTGTGKPRFYGTNPELLAQLQTQLATLQGFTDPRAANLVGLGEGEVQGFIEGRFSFEDVFGSLTGLLSKARQAVQGVSTKTPDSQAADDAFRAQQLAGERSDAFSRLRSLLSRFGLSELEGAVQNIITSGAVDLRDPDAIIFAVRGEAAYKKRFAANDARIKKGLAELDPSTYIGLEEQFRAVLRANGLPTGFYDDLTDFQKLIEGDVSPAELQTRVQEGYRKVRDADPEVRRQMQRLYGVDDNGLAAYFLDPDKATPILTTRARSAGIAARGLEQGGLTLTKEEAEGLVARGITPEEAQARFMQRGMLSGLYSPMTGEEALAGPEELGAIFEYDPVAQRRLAQRREQRLGEFRAGGQFARTSGATSGTVETGAGIAQ